LPEASGGREQRDREGHSPPAGMMGNQRKGSRGDAGLAQTEGEAGEEQGREGARQPEAEGRQRPDRDAHQEDRALVAAIGERTEERHRQRVEQHEGRAQQETELGIAQGQRLLCRRGHQGDQEPVAPGRELRSRQEKH
jgi:hypothetical protein